jgi:hypothetical protein
MKATVGERRKEETRMRKGNEKAGQSKKDEGRRK